MTRRLPFIGVVLSALVVTGCTHSEEQLAFHPTSFLGSSIAQLDTALPPETAYVVYDLSLPVAGTEATYGGADAGSNDAWLVVVSCGSEERLAVGVVNGADYNETIADSARKGDYDELLLECGDR